MGCCGNKQCDRPKAEMTIDLASMSALLEEGSAVLTKLIDIAKGGARFVGFKNAQTNELAATIAAIVSENNYLKNLLGIFHPGTAHTDENGVTISFGPRNTYKLFIPAFTESARTKLADSLMKAAEELKKTKPELPEQKWLPFVDCA